MEGALAWIGQVAEWIGQFIPRIRNVRLTHRAVKFRFGKAYIVEPGLKWYWPLITDFIEYPVVRQAVTLPEQTMVTSDYKTIVIGGMMIYEVEDLLILCSTTFSPDESVRDLSLTAVHDVACKMTWDDLTREQQRGTLDTKLRQGAQHELKTYGVKVVKLMLTDLAPTKVLRLVQTEAGKGNKSYV